MLLHETSASGRLLGSSRSGRVIRELAIDHDNRMHGDTSNNNYMD